MSPQASPHRLDAASIEVIDDSMAAILRAKTPAQRIAMVGAAHRTARHLIAAGVRVLHPDWTAEQVKAETARRLLDGTDRSAPVRD
jgi:hypothetical protein